MATREELNTVYQELLGRDVDPSGAATFADMDVEEVRGLVQQSTEYQRHDLSNKLQEAKDRGDRWYTGGASVSDEFSASSGGDWVLLKDDQSVADEYVDITENMPGYVPEGYRLYIDEGRSTGFLGLVDRTLGLDTTERFSARGLYNALNYGSNEHKMATMSSPHGSLMIEGSEGRERSVEYGDAWFDADQSTWETRSHWAESAATVVLGTIYPVLFWLPAAYNAAYADTYKTQGKYYERDQVDRSSLAEDFAWDFVIGYFSAKAGGGFGKAGTATNTSRVSYAAAAGGTAAARHKSEGGEWGEAAVVGGATAVSTGVRGNSATRVGLRAGAAGTSAYVAADENKGEAATKAAAFSLVRSYVTGYQDAKTQEQVGLGWGSAGGYLVSGVQAVEGAYSAERAREQKLADREAQREWVDSIVRPQRVMVRGGGGSGYSGGSQAETTSGGSGAARSPIRAIGV